MISNRSSIDHAAKYDFQRCMRENAFIPLCVTIITSYFLWQFVFLLIDNNYVEEFEWSIFSSYSGFSPIMFNMLYLACGALTAIKAFHFLTSTKRCNVYLSIGIDRKQLLKNRLITSLIFMFISCVVPVVVSVVANSISFVVSPALLETAAYLALTFFYNMLLGFGIAGAVILSVGNIVEAIGIYAVISMIPSIIKLAVDKLGNRLFNGFVVVKSEDYWGIEAYFPDWLTKIEPLLPCEYIDNVSMYAVSYKTNDISSGNWLILLCWFIVAILIISLMPKLMKKRKAEIAGAFGADRKLVAICATIIAFLMFTLWSSFEIDQEILRCALMVIMPVIGYIFTVTVIYRNDRDIRKNLLGAGITAAICLVLAVTSFTNGFGYFNKTPKAEDVEYAAIMPAACEMIEKGSDRTTIYNNALYGKFTDVEDINKIISIHERATENLGSGDARVSIVYKLKNGRIVARNYRNVSDDGAKASLEYIETNQYKNMVTEVLSLEKFDEDKEREKLADVLEKELTRLENAEYFFTANLFEFKADFTNSVPAILNSTLSNKIRLDEIMNKTEIVEFKKALAKDLTSMTVEQTFYPNEKPLYFIHFYRYDYVDNGSYETKNFPVYSFMSNTLDVLDKYNIQTYRMNEYTVDDIEAVQIKNVKEAIYEEARWDATIGSALDRTVCATYVGDYFYNEMGNVGIVYRHSDFNDPKEITDKATIERYYNNYRSQYSYIGDNGVFVKFVFKDGGDLIAYVPEKFV